MQPPDHDPLRRKRLRAQGYDYSTHGAYVVTICVDRMEHLFGAVHDGHMLRNAAGDLVERIWTRIPGRFPAVALDAWVVMPSHIHGIIWIRQGTGYSSPTLSRVIQAFKSESTVEYGRGVRAGQFPHTGAGCGNEDSTTRSCATIGCWRSNADTSKAIPANGSEIGTGEESAHGETSGMCHGAETSSATLQCGALGFGRSKLRVPATGERVSRRSMSVGRMAAARRGRAARRSASHRRAVGGSRSSG